MPKRASAGGLNPFLLGTWRCKSRGTSEQNLQPVRPGEGWETVLRADGTAEWRALNKRGRSRFPKDLAAPIPTAWEWEKYGKDVLTILIPIAPMPEYDMPDWTYEGVHYAVLGVTANTLTLSDRPFDGEFVEVYRRARAGATVP